MKPPDNSIRFRAVGKLFSDLTFTEKVELMRKRRKERREFKFERKTRKKKTAGEKVKLPKSKNVLVIPEGLSEEDKKELLAILQKQKGIEDGTT